MADFLAEIITINGLQDGIYVEPYAGGAGAALDLLFAEQVQYIIINDADPCVSTFWKVILDQETKFIELLDETPVTIDEWKKQADIYNNHLDHSPIEIAFASFFMNRCNHSGIMVKAGPIGGIEQTGKWKVDARYNKKELIRRIEKISFYKDRISVYNMDAIHLLKQVIIPSDSIGDMLVYLDPPYYDKGCKLYLNYYQHEDHAELANFINQQTSFKWILSYDNVPAIHQLYSNQNRVQFNLSYSANKRRIGSELLIYNDNILIPEDMSALQPVA